MDKTVPVVGLSQFAIEQLEDATANTADHEAIQFGPPREQGDLGFFAGHRVIRFIGSGAMGAVYEGMDTALQRRVALKVMLPYLSKTEKGRARFLHEARAVAKLAHPCIVRIYGTGIENDLPYLTMEYLEGQNLEQYIGTHADISIAIIVRIARSIALGLQAAHAQDIVHRDIKPENIWLEFRDPETIERVVLLDFGLAISAAGDGIVSKKLVGTPNYFSPEAATGNLTGPYSDMFSFGCILYRLLTKRLPFASTTILGLLNKIAECAPMPVKLANEQVPESLATLVDRLLAKNPADRPTPRSIIEALQPWETQQHTALRVNNTLGRLANRTIPNEAQDTNTVIVVRAPAVVQESRVQALEPTKRTRWTVAGAGVVLLVVLCVGTYFATRPKPQVMSAPPSNDTRFASERSLFNGVDLQGWHEHGSFDRKVWAIEQGRLRNNAITGQDRFLLTDEEFAEFEVRFQYRWLAPGGHTVFYFRAVETPTKVEGLGVNLGDDEGFPGVYGRPIGPLYQTGGIQGLVKSPISRNRPLGEWNTFTILVTNKVIEVKHNGTITAHVDVQEAKITNPQNAWLQLTRARMALHSHWGKVEYQDITVRPIKSAD